MKKSTAALCVIAALAVIVLMGPNKEVSKPVAPKPEKVEVAKPTNIYAELGKSINPLIMPGYGRYCSSSVISYKGKTFNFTNRHCCDVEQPLGMPEDTILIGEELASILYSSNKSDICILSTGKKKGLKVAKKAPSQYEEAFVIGYPLGEPQTLRKGHFNYSDSVCIPYGDDLLNPDFRCVESYVLSIIIRPGNSGSPTFNAKGEVIGIAYAGNDIDAIATTLEQLKAALDIAHAQR